MFNPWARPLFTNQIIQVHILERLKLLFRKFICNGCGMPTEDAYSSGHLVLSHFGTCMCSNVKTNLSWTCLVSGLLNFEHPSVLLFCFTKILLINMKCPFYEYSMAIWSSSSNSNFQTDQIFHTFLTFFPCCSDQFSKPARVIFTVDGLIFVGYLFSLFSWKVRIQFTNSRTNE